MWECEEKQKKMEVFQSVVYFWPVTNECVLDLFIAPLSTLPGELFIFSVGAKAFHHKLRTNLSRYSILSSSKIYFGSDKKTDEEEPSPASFY